MIMHHHALSMHYQRDHAWFTHDHARVIHFSKEFTNFPDHSLSTREAQILDIATTRDPFVTNAWSIHDQCMAHA